MPIHPDETPLLDSRCQRRVSTARTHQRSRARRCSGVAPYNSRTTRRAPTGSYQRIRQSWLHAWKGVAIRESTNERQPAPTAVGALITRRSQVQILPPPLNERPGHMAWAFDVVGRASPATSTGSASCESLTSDFAAVEPCVATSTTSAHRSSVSSRPHSLYRFRSMRTCPLASPMVTVRFMDPPRGIVRLMGRHPRSLVTPQLLPS